VLLPRTVLRKQAGKVLVVHRHVNGSVPTADEIDGVVRKAATQQDRAVIDDAWVVGVESDA
jgi:hypothetical protein